MSRSTWHYRKHPRPSQPDPVAHADRAYPSRISDADREQIEEFILAGWADQHSVDHSFAVAWDAGVMLASRRTWWRVAAGIEQQFLRPVISQRSSHKLPQQKPVLQATGPGQVWSWDITDLRSPWRGVVFKAYKITDIYSRQIVGWQVEEREADRLAVDMFAAAIAEHGVPEYVHADNGAVMRSGLLTDFLTSQRVTLSHNRPYVSDDNPFSEAGFRTMKYRPGYPKVFKDLDAARTYLCEYVPWYNGEHRHSGIALFTPGQVADGSWKEVWGVRDEALQAYYLAHPERFSRVPVTPRPGGVVGINLPAEEPSEIHAA